MIQVGSKINEYEVVARLRSGGMAALFLGRRQGAAGFHRPVAIKVVHPHLSEDKNFVSMFLDEAKLSARISHPNVVHVEELGQRGSLYYLVMEYVHGCALSQLARALRGRGRRFTPEMAVYIAMLTAEGLHAAHEAVGDDGQLLGVVHRDVSPQNVLLSYRGHVKLIDFGVAKARGRSQHTTVASLKGKLRYMAPEQAASQAVDRRTDVYALGIVLWELLTMRTLFKADNDLKLHDLVKSPVIEPPSKYAEGITPELDAVVMKALAPRIEDRPASASEFRKMLIQAVPGALAIDAEQLAALLRTVMVDTIRDQHRRLPESISMVLKRDVGDALEGTVEEASQKDAEALLELTTSASNLMGTDGGPVDSRGSHSAVQPDDEAFPAVPAWDAPVLEAEPEAEHVAEEEEAPGRVWMRWVGVAALLVLVGVVAFQLYRTEPPRTSPVASTPPVVSGEGTSPTVQIAPASSPAVAQDPAPSAAAAAPNPEVEPVDASPTPKARPGRTRATRDVGAVRAEGSAAGSDAIPAPTAPPGEIQDSLVLFDEHAPKAATKRPKAPRGGGDAPQPGAPIEDSSQLMTE